MAAGLGFKDFQTGEVLTAADVDGYLMQGIWVFTNATARDAAVTSPQEGNFAFTKDNNSLWYYDGAAWVASGATGDIEGVTAGTGISGGGTSGTVTITNSMATAIDAKGDLVAGTGADTFAKLTVGANDTVLTADSTAATGLKWAAPAGGGGSLTLLSTTTLSGASTTISSIDQTYNSLYVLITGVTNSTNDADFNCLPNNVNNLVSMGGFDQGSIFTGIYTSKIQLTGTNVEYKRSDANNVWTIQFYNYASTTDMKPFIANSSFIEPSYSDSRAVFLAGTFRSNTAISSLVFDVEGETFSSGTVKIYGVK
jgi:hypothetical protein